METLYIDTAEDLEALCQRLGRPEWLALDTEFMREKNYYPQLCLVQIATPELAACIDPLKLDELGPLLDLIFDPQVTKVLHAARQDLEIFYLLQGRVPAPVFDTQVAATVLGQGEQVGYGNLVKTLLEVELDKGHSRTDWSHRPLSEAQLRYAADDVIYLVQLYERQRELLQAKGRLEWLAEDFVELTSAATYDNPPAQAWQRVKGNNRLKGVQLAILQTLAAWREEQAQNSDKPRRWILKDEVLTDLARLRPDSPAKLKRIRGLEPGTIKRHGETLLRLIVEGGARPKAEWPRLKLPPRLAPEQEAVADALMAVVRQCAARHQVNATTIASRKELERFILGDEQAALRHGWRHALAGEVLEAVLRGESALRIEEGQLRLIPAT